MKYLDLLLLAMPLVCCASCKGQAMTRYIDPTHGEVSAKELPSALADKITKYDKLKSYTNLKLGAGIGLYFYMQDATYRNIVNDNFDEVTLDYNMKHGAMVNSKGEIDFTNVDACLAMLQANGLTVYGHCLVWHQNQNASYLNSLIAPAATTESANILKDAMEAWIKAMMGHYGGKVKAWDVLNEPMEENGAVRTDYAATTSDIFPWMKYLGKDYGVYAFKFARQYGSSDNLLFVNDYNLEVSLDKCDGLIEYVKYIESKGATIDGIGTQMHISITTDTTKIDKMFQKLAATGKLIKVSELDIKVNNANPTTATLALQSAMYQYVVKSYMKYVPAAQRYGITAWGISDSAKEHAFWIPNDAPCLWNKDYQRKHSYKGFADGLAGKDISLELSREIQIP